MRKAIHLRSHCRFFFLDHATIWLYERTSQLQFFCTRRSSESPFETAAATGGLVELFVGQSRRRAAGLRVEEATGRLAAGSTEICTSALTSFLPSTHRASSMETLENSASLADCFHAVIRRMGDRTARAAVRACEWPFRDQKHRWQRPRKKLLP